MKADPGLSRVEGRVLRGSIWTKLKPVLQIQAELGEGHMNVINAKEVLLTQTHLALVMEFAAGASLTSYVAEKWQAAQHTGLFLTEDEARYFFRVSNL